MNHYSIYIHQLDDGNYYEFGYYNYAGDNFEEDMKLLATEPPNKARVKICDVMQIPQEGYTSWTETESIYFNP